SQEAPLAIVNNDTVQEQEETLSANEQELLYYRKLLQGYFKKFTRWQAIAEAEGIETGAGERKIEVFTTPTGLHIAKLGEKHPPKDKVLEMLVKRLERRREDYMDYTIKPGQSGARKLVDLEGNPIFEAPINLEYFKSGQYQA